MAGQMGRKTKTLNAEKGGKKKKKETVVFSNINTINYFFRH
jgi:hypothetical protein